jgi:multicomponent Na+:H+ antiporter subunit B
MIYVLLSLWIVSALFLVGEQKIVRVILWFTVFSQLAAICFLLLGSPDVAMAEAVISAFTTIFFIVCFEKYFDLKTARVSEKTEAKKAWWKNLPPIAFTVFLATLFIMFIPDNYFDPYLKFMYLERFQTDIGGYNAVTAVLLGYRVYDTLFEALILVVAVVATVHLSHFGDEAVTEGKRSEVADSGMMMFIMRIVAPIMLIFGVYIFVNGFISAGGGFQGGLAVASFYVCRYMIYEIYDLPVHKIIRMEEVVFIAITLMAVVVIFQGVLGEMELYYLPLYQIIYMLTINVMIGLKVACGFVILFYRYIAVERK